MTQATIASNMMCECGHLFKHHTTNSPNPGYGCDHPIDTPKEFVGSILAGNWRCGCCDFRQKKVVELK